MERKRNLLCGAAAVLMPIACRLDRGNYGAHTMGISLVIAYGFALLAAACAIYALVRRRWALLIGCAAVLASAALCDRMTADWMYCSECRAMLPLFYLL